VVGTIPGHSWCCLRIGFGFIAENFEFLASFTSKARDFATEGLKH
jgi:hypothetical protein